MGSVNFLEHQVIPLLPPFLKRICQTKKENFFKKTFEFFQKTFEFLKRATKTFFFLLTLSFGMTKSASQCVNLECVIAHSEKLRFRQSLRSDFGQMFKIFCSFLWHLAQSWRKHCKSCNTLQRGLKIDIYCCKFIFFSPLGWTSPTSGHGTTSRVPLVWDWGLFLICYLVLEFLPLIL